MHEQILAQKEPKAIHSAMGCNCKKEEKISFLSIGEQKNTQRIDEVIEKNYGGFKNQIDRKRKIAILKRKRKL